MIKIKIGFLGPHGTFSEEALDNWINKSGLGPDSYEKIAFPTIIDVINAVGKRIDMAIVPIENSLEGSVNMTIDCLIHEAEVMIAGYQSFSICLPKKAYPLKK